MSLVTIRLLRIFLSAALLNISISYAQSTSVGHLNELVCTTGQIAKFDGVNWVCSDDISSLIARLDALEAENKMLKDRLSCVTSASNDTDFVFEGCNVHVRNGLGSTDSINGLGNLIIGYDKARIINSNKSGSHNLVIGDEHDYLSYGGLVAGLHNSISGKWATVSGGKQNYVYGDHSSISGGSNNIIYGRYSSISGGYENTASSFLDSISGGAQNLTFNSFSSISGGRENMTNGYYSSINGGWQNTASNVYSSVSGGLENTADGYTSSICGGYANTTSGSWDSISGGRWNRTIGTASSITGGESNIADGYYSSISGGRENQTLLNNGRWASIGGGYRTVVNGAYNWAAGDLYTSD